MPNGFHNCVNGTDTPSNTQIVNLYSVEYRNINQPKPRNSSCVEKNNFEDAINSQKYNYCSVAAIPPDISKQKNNNLSFMTQNLNNDFMKPFTKPQVYYTNDYNNKVIESKEDFIKPAFASFITEDLLGSKENIEDLSIREHSMPQSTEMFSTQTNNNAFSRNLMFNRKKNIQQAHGKFKQTSNTSCIPRSISEHQVLTLSRTNNSAGGNNSMLASNQAAGDRTSHGSDSSSGAFSSFEASRIHCEDVSNRALKSLECVENDVYMQTKTCDSAIDVDSDDDDVIEEFNRLHREYDEESIDSRDRSGRESEEAVSLSASSSSASFLYRDQIRDCLERDPADRSDDDIELLVDFLTRLPAVANLPQNVRLQLCSVLVFVSMGDAGTVVLHDGEELDSWSVIINGSVEIEHSDASVEELHVGDSFGVNPSLEKLFQKGVMRTKVPECQFVCVAQADYHRILNNGEETCRLVTKNGCAVLALENRIADASQNRYEEVAIKGTPEMLISHLIEGEHSQESSADPTYTEDFLLTYRMFLPNPTLIAEKLLHSFNEPMMKERVIRIVLMWVNNHFIDFEAHPIMINFLEQFTTSLEAGNKGSQLKLLYVTCAAKARQRTVTLTRSKREETLNFSVLGGWDRGFGVYICHVEEASKAEHVGLRRGDQILKVNGVPFEHIEHEKALSVLRGATMLIITVQSNLFGFREMLTNPPDDARHRHRHRKNLVKDINNMNLEGATMEDPMFGKSVDVVEITDEKRKQNGFMTMGSNRSKLKWALRKMLPKSASTAEAVVDADVSNVVLISSNPDPTSNGRLYHSRSNPDLIAAQSECSVQVKIEQTKKKFSRGSETVGAAVDQNDTAQQSPDQVIKVFRSDQSFKYLFVHRETSAQEVVMLALSEFGISDVSKNYSLFQVSAEGASDKPGEVNVITKKRRLPDTMQGLAESIPLNGRFYLKNNLSQDPNESQLMSDEIARNVWAESRTNFLQLNTFELAVQLTLQDYAVFSKIEPTDYIEELCCAKKEIGDNCSALSEFTELVNREMFWVVCEICREAHSAARRAKIIKHFIKLAKHCHDLRNFNSCFAIIGGLGHGCVSRLRQTWDRLPSKYNRVYETLQTLMDPSRNMSKYRQLVSKFNNNPPLIPFYPVVRKDLTFLNEGNNTFEVIEGDAKHAGQRIKLVKFEKLRMIAREVRMLRTYASAPYNLEEMFASNACGAGHDRTIAALASLNSNAATTTNAGTKSAQTGRKHSSRSLPNRRRNGPNPVNLSAKKMFEDGQMVRRVKQYLTNLNIVADENKLLELSKFCESPTNQSSTISHSARTNNQKPNKNSRSHKSSDAGGTRPRRVFLAENGSNASNGNLQAQQASRHQADRSTVMFGQESPHALQKLLSLSEKARPHQPPKAPTSFPSSMQRNGHPHTLRNLPMPPHILTRMPPDSFKANGHPIMLHPVVAAQNRQQINSKIHYAQYRDEYPDNSHAHYHMMPVMQQQAHAYVLARSYLPAESSSVSAYNQFSDRLMRSHQNGSVTSQESEPDSGMCLMQDSMGSQASSDSPGSLHAPYSTSERDYAANCATLTNRRSRHPKNTPVAPELDKNNKRSQSAGNTGKRTVPRANALLNADQSGNNVKAGKSPISAV